QSPDYSVAPPYGLCSLPGIAVMGFHSGFSKPIIIIFPCPRAPDSVIQRARITLMPKKPKRSPKGNDLVIAPGGPRKRKTVRAVKAGESVFVQQGYGPVITRNPRGIGTDKMRSADAPANFVLTPGGFRHR